SGHRVRMLFLEATVAELVRRYGATRRKHPLAEANSGVEQAVSKERSLLEPVKAEADLVIDTTNLTIHQLKNQLTEIFSESGANDSMQVSVVSFGYKHGIPLDVDLVFDVRFLPNPHWDENLRQLSGLDEAVRDYVIGNELTAKFLSHLESLLQFLLPAYKSEGKSYLTVAIGCTGGRHRSVVIAEQIKIWLQENSHKPRVTHRDISR
ncbi:MAG: RNase adapter RapZ, partial [Actinomycetota bacterium]